MFLYNIILTLATIVLIVLFARFLHIRLNKDEHGSDKNARAAWRAFARNMLFENMMTWKESLGVLYHALKAMLILAVLVFVVFGGILLVLKASAS